MAEGDVGQGFVTFLVSNSDEVNQSEDVLSPEDAAWVDSCLVNDPGLSDDNWNAFKDALLDIVSLQPTSNYNASASEGEEIPRGVYDERVPMNEEAGASEYPESVKGDSISENAELAEFLGATDDNLFPRGVYDEHVPMNEEAGISEYPERVKSDLVSIFENEELAEFLGATDDNLFARRVYDENVPMNEEAGASEFSESLEGDLVSSSENAEIAKFLGVAEDILFPIGKKKGTAQFQNYLKKGFLSNYRDLEEKEYNNFEVEDDNEIESSSENIFKVWDLDTWTEEDELISELKKALAEGAIQDAPPTLDDSFSDSGKGKLDDLISGIANLSLHPSSN